MIRLFISVLLLGVLNSAFSQVQWELNRDEDGIRIYTGKGASSKYKEIKVEATLTGTIQKLMSILVGVNHTKGWVYGTKDSYIIKKVSANEILYYSETALPWPVSNRDIPIKMVLNPDTKNNSLKVVASGIPGAIPEKKGIVRIPYFNAYWDVKSDGRNRLNIIYILKMDPGGSIPAGVTNIFVSKGPFETFKNLSQKLRQ